MQSNLYYVASMDFAVFSFVGILSGLIYYFFTFLLQTIFEIKLTMDEIPVSPDNPVNGQFSGFITTKSLFK